MRETNRSQYTHIKERYRKTKKQVGEPYDILPYLYTGNVLGVGKSRIAQIERGN